MNECSKTQNVVLFETKSSKNGIAIKEENYLWFTGEIKRSIQLGDLCWSPEVGAPLGFQASPFELLLSLLLLLLYNYCYHHH